MKKLGLVSIALSALLLSTASWGQTLEKIARERKIVFGHYPDSIPFSYFTDPKAKDAKPVGYAIDLCENIANAVKKQLNLPTLAIEYKIVDGKTRFSDLENNKIDVECGSSTNNTERRARVAFTVPHFVGGLKFLSRASSPVNDVTDLNGKTIAHIKGGGDWSTLEAAMQSGIKMKVLEGADTLETFNAVVSGKADAMLWDDSVLVGLRADSKEPSALVLSNKLLTVEALALMFRKNDPSFKTLVDEEMRRTIYSGDFQRIYSRWFEKPIPPKGVVLNYPMNFLTKVAIRYPSDKLGDDYFLVKGTMDN